MKRLCWMIGILALITTTAHAQTGVTKYVRYSAGGQEAYGIVDGQDVRELRGNIFTNAQPTGKRLKLSEVKLLAPVQPSKVIAIGLNYKSHIGNRPDPPKPIIFAKMTTSIIGPEENILYHPGVTDLHYEAELVVVIGKKTSRITPAEAKSHIFGITAGNDVSERKWQQEEPQWFRAKGSDTFGPIGPMLVSGLDYNNLLVQSRLNGQTKQSQSTKDLIFNVDYLVSYLSQFVTLMPGDVIFTGTPGSTSAMKPGDVIEIEVEGVGVLKNRIAATGSND